MDTNDESKRDLEASDQRDNFNAPSPPDGASATGMLQVPDLNGATMNLPAAPVPDAHIISALEEEILDEEAAVKKPRVNFAVIEDEDSAPLPAAAMVAAIHDEYVAGKAKKGPGIVKGDDGPVDLFGGYNVDDYMGIDHFLLNQDRDNNQDPQPQPPMTVPPSHQSPLRMTVPSPTHLNQDGEFIRDPPDASVQDAQLRVRHTPQSLLPHPSMANDNLTPSAPILEATPVDNQIYDAEVVPTNPDIEEGQNNNNTGKTEAEEELSWWKKHQRYGIFGIVLVLCVVVTALGTVLGSNSKSDGVTVDNNESESAIPGVGAKPTESPTTPLVPKDPMEGESNNSTMLLDTPSYAPTPPAILNSILSSQTKLLPHDGAGADLFGIGVSMSGETIVVGARGDADNGIDSGSAYIFIWEGNTWIEQAKLLPNDGQEGNRFGYAVSVSDSTVVIGAYRDDDNGIDSGSAYIFVREGTTWKQQAKLLPNDGQEGDKFGYSVSVSGDTAVVGAYWDDDNGSNSGSAYVFIQEGGTWKQQAKLLPNDGAIDDVFGYSVSVSGDTIVVGAHGDDDNGSASGSAYVFIRDGGSWNQHAKLLPNDGAANDRFGYAVSADGDTIVVGAQYDYDNGSNSGSASVFIREGDMWIEQAKLLPNDGAANDRFGRAVSVSVDTIVVGAVRDDDNGSNSGSAYVFIREGDMWIEQAKLLPNDGAADDRFGCAVSVSGDTVVVGAWLDDDENNRGSGSAYVFPLQRS